MDRTASLRKNDCSRWQNSQSKLLRYISGHVPIAGAHYMAILGAIHVRDLKPRNVAARRNSLFDAFRRTATLNSGYDLNRHNLPAGKRWIALVSQKAARYSRLPHGDLIKGQALTSFVKSF